MSNMRKNASRGTGFSGQAEGDVEFANEQQGARGMESGGMQGIAERMDVIASCGKKVGVVDHVEGLAIKLTKNDSPDRQHHYIPTDWVDHVDQHVHLKKNSMETEQGWKPDAASCGC